MLEGKRERGFELGKHMFDEERWRRVKFVEEDTLNGVEANPEQVKESER